MRTITLLVSSLTAATLLAACGGSTPMDETMRADLEAASAATIELAPRGQGQQVVSAIESRTPRQPQVAPVRRVTGPAPEAPPETPEVTQVSDPAPAAARPSSKPAISPPPPGGYKTVGEVIRNAPFPIKP